MRRDRWFNQPDEIGAYLKELCSKHSAEKAEDVSDALLQARRNLARGSCKKALESEVARLLTLLKGAQLASF